MKLAIVSDLHAGSTVAICPPKMYRDDNQEVLASPIQLHLLGFWNQCWAEFEAYTNGEPWVLVLLGDMFEGHHHNTNQTMGPAGENGIEFRACHELLKTPLAIPNLKGIHVIRGTEAHVGTAGNKEETLARVLAAGDEDLPAQPVIPCLDLPSNKSSWRRKVMLDGVLVDFAHHGRFGQRAHTKESYLRWYAQDIWMEHALDGDAPPELVFRGHNHQYGDTGTLHRFNTRVVSCPCWQLPTNFAHRRAFESLPSIGLVMANIEAGRVEILPKLMKLERPRVHV